MKCWVGSKNPVKVGATAAVLSRALEGDIATTGVDVPSGVPDQPMTESATRQGAINRVNACLALDSFTENDWAVAIEGGVDNFEDGPATFAYVALCHQGRWSVTRSASLPLPPAVYQALLQGEELGSVMDRIFRTENIKQKGGAIGLLTHNMATRQSVYEVALTLAMSRFHFPALYPDKVK